MNWARFVPSTLYLASVGSLLMMGLMLGLGLFCDECVASDPEASVEGYLSTACVYLVCAVWTAGVGTLLRPLTSRWNRLIAWALYAASAIQLLLGLVVVLEGMILAEEPDGGAFFGAGVLLALSILSLGLGALVGREAPPTPPVP